MFTLATLIDSTIAFLKPHADLLAVVISILTGLGTLYGLWRKVLKAKFYSLISPVTSKCQQIDDLSKNFGNLDKKVTAIYETLGPNGGKSLYDKIHAMDKSLALNNLRTEMSANIMEVAEFLSDTRGHCVKVNDVAIKITNRPETDFLGNNWINVVLEDDRESVVEDWMSAISGKRDFKRIYHWTTSHGHPIKIDVIAKPVYNSTNKEFLGYLGIAKIIK